jgi:hypothetical protein
MNDNTCYICGNPNSMRDDNWIVQIDGTYTHYHTECLNAQIETLGKYKLELSMRVIWEGEYDMEGSILCINSETDGNGHYLSLRNKQGGVDEVPMSMLKYKMVNELWFDVDDDASDITRAHNVSIDPVAENRMVVACTNSNGEPDFAFVRVRCTQSQRENGLDYRAAKKWAKENGYGCAMVAFNCEVDSAGQSIVDQFTWESASIISI